MSKHCYMITATGVCKTHGIIRTMSFVLAESYSEALQQGVSNLITVNSSHSFNVIQEVFGLPIEDDIVIAAAADLQSAKS
jgi:hypothetical protein